MLPGALPSSRRRRRARGLPVALGLVLALTLGALAWAETRPEARGPPARAADRLASESAAERAGDAPRALAELDDDAKDFPSDLLLSQPYKDSAGKGWVLVHIIGICYMFVALTLVCDGYFMTALELICETYKIEEDVAGATFMAAGGSAPELFTSVMGVFVADSDVGFSTIVGSAVFNVLFVIGLCAIACKGTLDLTWWPLFRDCSYYICSLIVLSVFVEDQTVEWWEATILFCLYLLYIFVMKNNKKLKAWAEDKVDARQNRRRVATGETEVRSLREAEAAVSYSRQNSVNSVLHNMRAVALKVLLTGNLEENQRLRLERARRNSKTPALKLAALMVMNQNAAAKKGKNAATAVAPVPDEAAEAAEPEGPPEEDASPGSPFEWPETTAERCWHVLCFPLSFMLYITLPDCTKDHWKGFFLVTFAGSLVWVAAYSYCMVWWATVVGEALGIPTAVMGITFLAAGTSIPDALSSVFVARAGFGDMAVSSSIGSNVFDILVGLPVPWMLKTMVVDAGSTVSINSKWLVINVVTLVGMVLAVVLSIIHTGWKLDKKLGSIMFVLYLLFIAESLVLELELISF